MTKTRIVFFSLVVVLSAAMTGLLVERPPNISFEEMR